MKKALGFLLSAIMVFSLLPFDAFGAEDLVSPDQQMRKALRLRDGRDITQQSFISLPGSGLRCGLVLTRKDPGNWQEELNFTYWFLQDGQAPRQVLDGLSQAAPSDAYLDDRTHPGEYVQGFVHQDQGYFILSARTGERQSEFSELYMVKGGELVLIGTLGGEAIYHPSTGLFTMQREYTSEASIEGEVTFVPYFINLSGEKLTALAGIPLVLEDLRALSNGLNIIKSLQNLSGKLVNIHYLPNHMLVVNLEKWDSGDVAYYHVLFGIENGLAIPVKLPYPYYNPDPDKPFWESKSMTRDALVEGVYQIRETMDTALKPEAFLKPDAGAVSFGQEAAVTVEEQLKAFFESPHRGSASPEQVAQLARVIGNAPNAPRDLMVWLLSKIQAGTLDQAGMGAYQLCFKDVNGNGSLDPEDLKANSLNLDLLKDQQNQRAPYQTFFHEAAHAMDLLLGGSTCQPPQVNLFSQSFRGDVGGQAQVSLEEVTRGDVQRNLMQTIQMLSVDGEQANRVLALFNDPLQEVLNHNEEDLRVKREVQRYFNKMFQATGYTLADVFGEATGYRIFLDTTSEEVGMGYSALLDQTVDGKRLPTWQEGESPAPYSRTLPLSSELFAGFFSALIRNDATALNYYRVFLPDSYRLMEEMVGSMLAASQEP